MNSAKWTLGAIGYMTVFAYAIALIVFQLGSWIATGVFTIATGIAIALLAFLLYMLLRKNPYDKTVAAK